MPQAEAENQTAELFGQALSLQQQKKWDEALEVYKKIADLGPAALDEAQASVALHNMSLIALEKADTAMAYIWSKKAYFLQPSNRQVEKTFEHVQTLFQPPKIPKQLTSTQQLKTLVQSLPQDLIYGMSLLLLLLTLFILSRKIIQKMQSKAQQVFQKISWWPLYLSGILCAASLALSFWTYQAHRHPKGLIRTEKAAIQIVPGEGKAVIFEAPQGLEVEILESEQDFYQVQHAGAFIGWTLRSQVEVLSLSFQQ